MVGSSVFHKCFSIKTLIVGKTIYECYTPYEGVNLVTENRRILGVFGQKLGGKYFFYV